MDGLGSADTFEFETFRFDRACGCLFRLDGPGVIEPVALGSRALALLALLVERQGQLVLKDEIMQAVWPGAAVEEANLTVQISALRRLLDRDRKQGSCIQTIPGRGYRFVPSVKRAETLAASISTPGNGSGGPIAADAQPVSPSAPCSRDGSSTVAAPAASLRRGRAVMAMVVGALCLVAVAAAVNWRSLAPWEVRSAPRPSIIVLPFADLSGDGDGRHLVDAVTSDLTTDLSGIWDMVVISRDIASSYRGKSIDAKQIGQELGVRYVLEGSIELSQGRVQVNFQLVDAASGLQLRAERFDAERPNAAEMQNEITGRIARTLRFALMEVVRGRVEREGPGQSSALDLVMAGWDRLIRGDTNQAEIQRLFERALEIDPQFVDARLGLARTMILQLAYPRTGIFQRTETRIEQLLGEALKIDRNNAETHATTGILRRVQNRLTESRTELEMAVALDQSNSWAYYQLGVTLMYLGQPEAGIPNIERAMRLHPRGMADYYWGLGACHLLLGHVDEAIELLRKARAVNPRPYFINQWLAAALGLKGDLDEARAALAEMLRIKPELTSLEEIRIHYPWSTNPEHAALREQTIDLGLRRAGLPDR
jgi:adenylate cyclase